MKKALFTIVLFLRIMTGATAQTQEYKEEFKKMMELSGSDAMIKNMVPQMLKVMKQQGKELPEEMEQFIKTEMKTYMDEVIGKMDSVYYKYLTLEDLKELNKLYQSPVWTKMKKVQPQIQQELMPNMQKMALDISNKIKELLEKKGH